MRSQYVIGRSLTLLTLAGALFISGCQGGASTASTSATTTGGTQTSTSAVPGQPTATARPTASATQAPTATLAPEPSPGVPTGHLLYTGNGNLYALDISRQLLAWTDHNNHGNQYPYAPLICQGQIITEALPETPTLQSVNPQNGAVVWSAHVTNGQPVGCDSNHIYVMTNSAVIAYDYVTGAKAWSASLASYGIVLGNGIIYTNSVPIGLAAQDAATGAKRWTALPNPDGNYYALAASANAVFAVSSYDSILHALAASDGHELWHVTIPQTPSLSYADGIVYASTYTDNLLALSATDGHQLWQLTTHGHDPGLPTVANGVAYLAASDTHFYAVNEQTGALLWKLTAPVNAVYTGQPVLDANVLFYVQSYGPYSQQIIGINPQTQQVVWAYSAPGGVGQLVLLSS